MIDHGAAFPVFDVLGQNAHWFSPKEQPIWTGVVQCLQDNMPPTVEAVATRCSTSHGYIQSVANQWNDEDGRQVVYYSQELKKIGMLADLRSVGREVAELDDPLALDTAIEYAIARLSTVAAMQTSRSADAQSVGESAWEELESSTEKCVKTGMGWFDDIAGGIWTGMNYWIAAAYKQGKTTLMRNLILSAVDQGVACDAFCAEGTREMFALDCQAMIATRLLCEQGERDQSKLRLSGLFIRRSWRKGEASFTKVELEAIKAAREMWNTMNIRVWDTKDGIRNLATLRHRIQQSKFEYGSLVHWLDYSQLFGSGETLFERQSTTSQIIQEIAQAEGVALCALAQKNEQAIRSESDSYSVGVKGGGDASAAADFLLVPKIDKDSDMLFHVKLKHSRHTATGYGQHIINRTSGLFLDKWFSAANQPIYL